MNLSDLLMRKSWLSDRFKEYVISCPKMFSFLLFYFCIFGVDLLCVICQLMFVSFLYYSYELDHLVHDKIFVPLQRAE